MSSPDNTESPIIVFLQNAWSEVYAGSVWPRRSWLAALQRSRSGQRLRLLIDDYNVCENTTPIVGGTPSSVVPPDENHIRGILETRKPRVVVCCGRQAERALSAIWQGPLLVVPHPAHRLLTDKLYEQARRLLAAGLSDRLSLAQGKGRVTQSRLGSPVIPAIRPL